MAKLNILARISYFMDFLKIKLIYLGKNKFICQIYMFIYTENKIDILLSNLYVYIHIYFNRMLCHFRTYFMNISLDNC